MWIDPKGLLFGYPSREVRRLLIRFMSGPSTDQLIEEVLSLSSRRARELRGQLVAEGYLKLDSENRGQQFWEPTTKGLALAHASAARPLTRATAERRLQDFLERVERVNAGDYAYRVAKVAVFGSFCSDAQRINDVDVMVDLQHRHEDLEAHLACCRRRTELAEENGRSFSYYGNAMRWPRHEVLYALKARSRAIAIHLWENHEHFLETRPHRIVYEEGIGREAGRQ